MTEHLSDTDRDIVDLLVEHRVATVAHLGFLLDIPERTVRYRLAGLKSKGYALSVRPPADKGSSPDHWCPTRRADSWAKGERSPHGGDRSAPSTTFVEHSAAITGLYVALLDAASIGLELIEWVREAKATEAFEWRGRARKIVPDAFVVVAHDRAQYRAFVEIDLGSMSMTRLSQKLSAYAAYYAGQAWKESHPFPPVLLLLTTNEKRAEAAIRRFEQRLAQASRHLDRWASLRHQQWTTEIGSCAAARRPDEAIAEPVWISSGATDGLCLTDLARPSWERWAEHEARWAEEMDRRERLRVELIADPDRCRKEIERSMSSGSFHSLAHAFQEQERVALELLLVRRGAMEPIEKLAFGFFSARLAVTDRDGLAASHDAPPPDQQELEAVESLVGRYLERQKRYAARLYALAPGCVDIHQAIAQLDQNRLLAAEEIGRLATLVRSHRRSLAQLQDLRRAYESWRQQEIEVAKTEFKTLARLTFDSHRAALEIDLERLWVCRHCRQLAIPGEHRRDSARAPECCFCHLSADASLLDALKEGLVRADEGGFWEICQLPVPAWVTDEAQRPSGTDIDEEW